GSNATEAPREIAFLFAWQVVQTFPSNRASGEICVSTLPGIAALPVVTGLAASERGLVATGEDDELIALSMGCLHLADWQAKSIIN
ncbi:hypothetical protein, partial [Chromobacterium amazonense]|uniref:hypothetical protein n=1 Tax=Chromobacterium amazonense TaxID=1382803 RepID=UPI0021B784B3